MSPVTVEQVLRQTGFSDQEIQQLDQRALGAFTGVLTSAQQQREAAELAQQANRQFYDETIAPSLYSWELEKNQLENDRAKLAAEAAFYREANAKARESGFIAPDSPTFQQRDSQTGRYVAGSGGSPTFEG